MCQVYSFESSLTNANKEMTNWMFSGYQGIYMVQKDRVEDKIEGAGASLVMQ